jgi:hypothetical protein
MGVERGPASGVHAVMRPDSSNYLAGFAALSTLKRLE